MLQSLILTVIAVWISVWAFRYCSGVRNEMNEMLANVTGAEGRLEARRRFCASIDGQGHTATAKASHLTERVAELGRLPGPPNPSTGRFAIYAVAQQAFPDPAGVQVISQVVDKGESARLQLAAAEIALSDSRTAYNLALKQVPRGWVAENIFGFRPIP